MLLFLESQGFAASQENNNWNKENLLKAISLLWFRWYKQWHRITHVPFEQLQYPSLESVHCHWVTELHQTSYNQIDHLLGRISTQSIFRLYSFQFCGTCSEDKRLTISFLTSKLKPIFLKYAEQNLVWLTLVWRSECSIPGTLISVSLAGVLDRGIKQANDSPEDPYAHTG